MFKKPLFLLYLLTLALGQCLLLQCDSAKKEQGPTAGATAPASPVIQEWSGLEDFDKSAFIIEDL